MLALAARVPMKKSGEGFSSPRPTRLIGSSFRMKLMISSALNCLKSAFRLPRTHAAATFSLARLSSLTLVPRGESTIYFPSRLKMTSLPAETPAAVRMCLGTVICPLFGNQHAGLAGEQERK